MTAGNLFAFKTAVFSQGRVGLGDQLILLNISGKIFYLTADLAVLNLAVRCFQKP